MNDKKNDFLLTIKTFYGAEQVLKEELEELGYKDVVLLNRAVQLHGNLKDIYFLNFHLRCALSILVQIASFRIKNEEDLYKQAKKIDWTTYFDVNKTFAVKGAINSDLFRNTHYPFLLIKDAICDTFREKLDDRPNVEKKVPQVVIDAYIRNDEVVLSLNTSGAPLFQRGYRTETGVAPLNEVTAAILIRLSGWDRKSDFMDAFCGSGTLLVEAALLALNIPSNCERQHYAFKNFKNYDEKLWTEIYEAVNRRPQPLPFKISGSDINSEMVMKAKRNLRAFPFGRFIDITVNDFKDVQPTSSNGTLISNPPYGERMGEELDEMYEAMGDWFKNSLQGWNCWVISSNYEAIKHIGLKPSKKIKLYNGDLECSFRKFEIFGGSRREHVLEKLDKSDD